MAMIQLHNRNINPVFTDGIKEIDSPSDNRYSFCVSNPHPSPTNKLKDGPAKHAAILRTIRATKHTSQNSVNEYVKKKLK